jgi:hypothetical protein
VKSTIPTIDVGELLLRFDVLGEIDAQASAQGMYVEGRVRIAAWYARARPAERHLGDKDVRIQRPPGYHVQ